MTHTNELDALMARYAAGDDGCFPALHARLAPPLTRFLRALAGDDAGDVLQETFLRIHRHRARFDRGQPALPWALTVARRAFVDERRRRARRPSCGGDGARAEEIAGVRDPERAIEAALTAAGVLDRLPPLYRDTFTALVTAGTQREAARRLGASAGAIKLRVFRARRWLEARAA